MKIRNDPSTKPYFRCLSCPQFRKECGGMPTRGMDLQEWCEYLRDVKEAFHLTNAYIAEKAEVSIATVERIMAINIDKDIKRYTARRIEMVVLGEVHQHFCATDHSFAAATIARLQEDVAYWKETAEEWKAQSKRNGKIIDKYLDN